MGIERGSSQILQPDRAVTEDRDAKCCLGFSQGAEVRVGIPLHLRPELRRQGIQTMQGLRIVELAQESLVLSGKPSGRHWHLAEKPLYFGKGVSVELCPFEGN